MTFELGVITDFHADPSPGKPPPRRFELWFVSFLVPPPEAADNPALPEAKMFPPTPASCAPATAVCTTSPAVHDLKLAGASPPYPVSPLDDAAVEALRPMCAGKLVVVIGRPGSGRSTLGARLAGPNARCLPCQDLAHHLVQELRQRRSDASNGLREPRPLVVDEVGWLDGRERITQAVMELLTARLAAGHVSILIQGRRDGSLTEILRGLPAPVVVEVVEPPREKKAVWVRERALHLGLAEDDPSVLAATDIEPWTLAAAHALLLQAAARLGLSR